MENYTSGMSLEMHFSCLSIFYDSASLFKKEEDEEKKEAKRFWIFFPFFLFFYFLTLNAIKKCL